jgi:hypothetical protein
MRYVKAALMLHTARGVQYFEPLFSMGTT